MKLAPRCYVCGKPVGPRFCLAAMQTVVDRVFIAHLDCACVMDQVFTLEVKAQA